MRPTLSPLAARIEPLAHLFRPSGRRPDRMTLQMIRDHLGEPNLPLREVTRAMKQLGWSKAGRSLTVEGKLVGTCYLPDQATRQIWSAEDHALYAMV